MKAKSNKPTKKYITNVVQNYKLFRTSLRVQTKVFFEHSTLHGVRYIAEDGRPFFEKFMWFSCVLIGFISTAVIIVSLWEKFQTNPTITGLDTDFHNWDVPFPAIVVCQEKPFNNKLREEFLKNRNYNDSTKGITELDLVTMLSYPFLKSIETFKFNELIKDDENLKEIAFGMMNRAEDVFNECEFKTTPFVCSEIFFPVFTENGFCYAFNSHHFEHEDDDDDDDDDDHSPVRDIKETDLKWSLRFSVKDGSTNMPIYILNAEDKAGVDIQPQYIWDYKVYILSFSVKQTYTTEDTRQLSIKQRHCVFSNEIKLVIDDHYTYTACAQQCRMDSSVKKCGCIPYFYPKSEGYKHCTIKNVKCIYDNQKYITSLDSCSCRLGCSNTVYEVDKLNEFVPGASEGSAKSLEVRFVSWPMVRYKREVLFGWVDLLVSFGGIAGLFLGFSLLSGVEIIYYFTMRAICMVIRDPQELVQIQQKEASKPPPDYDLTLMPYICSKPLPGNGLNEVAKGYYQKNLYNNKIVPLRGPKWNRNDPMRPPFGIEFTN